MDFFDPRKNRIKHGQEIVMSKHEERMMLRDRLYSVLVNASGKRPEMEVDEWLKYERDQMLEAVNSERGKRGKENLPVQKVERVERMASGHSDYGRKFALYCAELVLDEM